MADSGFGLNFGGGFNSTPGGTYSTRNPISEAGTQSGFQRLADQQRADQQSRLMNQQGALSRELSGYQQASNERMAAMQAGVATQGYASQERQNAARLAEQHAALMQHQANYAAASPYAIQGMQTANRLLNSEGYGQTGTQPTISAAPVLSPQQIQQQVNSMRAGNDMSTAGNIRQMQGSLGGRGVGASSPLAAELGAMYQGQGLQANTQGEMNTRINAAQANAKQVLTAQQAQEQQYANRQGEAAARLQALLGNVTGLSGTLLGSA